MWTRKDLKERAKSAFKLNYWRCVLVALVLTVFAGGSSGGGSSGVSSLSNRLTKKNQSNSVEYSDSTDATNNELYEALQSDQGNDEFFHFNSSLDMSPEEKAAMITSFIVIFTIVFLVIMAVVILLDVYIFNPLELGCDRFFLKNLDGPGNVANVCFAFDNGYKNIIRIMFFRDLYTVLWTLLFIIPGIIKSYEYKMIPYLLSENPNMTKEEAFAVSKQMMDGNKWKAFVLDLSFLGWYILSAFTCGILSIFYVAPYVFSTYAALYQTLRYGNVSTTGNEYVEMPTNNMVQ